MSYDLYRNAILAIAANEKNGDDVEAEITALARAAKMDVTSIRHEVSEAHEMID